MTGVERKGEREGGEGGRERSGVDPIKRNSRFIPLNCNKVCQNCQLQQWYKKIYKSYLEAPQGTHLE